MEKWIGKYRGINPGAILERELKRKKLKQASFAKAISLPAQTLNAVIRGKRNLTPEMAFKIDRALGFEEGTMAVVQAYYDTKVIKEKLGGIDRPDIAKLRRILFWDTDPEKIDWQQHGNAVIRRVWERGNASEKQEIRRFYGADRVQQIINDQRPARPVPASSKHRSR